MARKKQGKPKTSVNTVSTASTNPPRRVLPAVTPPPKSLFETNDGKTTLTLLVVIFLVLLILIGVICLGIWIYHKMYRKAIEKQQEMERSKTKTVGTQTKLLGRDMEEYRRRMETVYMSTYQGRQLPGKIDLPARWHQQNPADFTEPWPKYYRTEQSEYITKVD